MGMIYLARHDASNGGEGSFTLKPLDTGRAL
jgi:hypothetical protein